ncbi:MULTISPECIES: YagK/YfjJ domain-containing protein [Enterobacterales]|uniref:YagK/YfjJ domain-containing protein n=1 Tax=Enterobacterales TaxID=91347 RepID=UPI000BA710EE|nr:MULTISPECIES: inovirus-type Gp2 protein [Enterobacterales]MBU2671684.1 inovirus-type Gp2 protein [Hafnia paralvei]HDR2751159.1 inovirus-type Gp2 protein [Enterobacter asburiae]HDR2775500.1 inovirus-type Gp2 protein [Enterobacter asburiae]
MSSLRCFCWVIASLIQKAWLSALRISGFNEYRTLVHFPENPRYYLNINANNFRQVYEDLSFRLSYFAKKRTKSYSREIRSFGCSQK